jgi:predicted AlkP superfamily pyrophosphatase or phosphodiesterase
MLPSRIRAIVLVLFLVTGAIAADRIADLRPTVILVSIDGFRADYLGTETPNLNSLAERGVHAKWLIPSFPTKTFPNHYTIVTGLYPAHHGIVANSIWDESIDAKFTSSDRSQVQNSKWWGGEPIWATAEKQGLRCAPLDWPGSEAEIKETRPSYWQEFDSKRTADERVATLLPFLDKPAPDRPRFLTLYMSEVDEAGHNFGPRSPQVHEALAKVDSAFGKLLAGLRERGIEDQVNIIVVSDHGMSSTSRKKLIFLDDYIDLKEVRIADWGPPIALNAIDGNNAALVDKLRHLRHAKVYLSADLPRRWHYVDSPRIQPVIVMPDDEWTMNSHEYMDKHADFQHGGQHGYDNELKSMRALFIAAGPSFNHAAMKPFSNVHIYSLLAALLNVHPAETDGSLDVFRNVLIRRGETEVPRPARAPWRKERDEVAVVAR